ncbi:LOW QUALITY PROTEIN: uncharacterized protein Dere_GG27274 [Drosophila erecta]|uniref:Uncharacterized protein n=1 Tax=Drosophila erecta TaxID=7220 RepID=A0A0Q5VZ93_DROER|nr:LOW QUALITY PROTEIN: uncharacterized protein Dere_GG27274 [Drosophila erecta]
MQTDSNKTEPEPKMTSTSSVLNIGSDSEELNYKLPKTSNPKAYFELEFENHMRKLLLNGEKPKELDENSIERFAATQIMRNGKQYYEFVPDGFKTGVIISGGSFLPKDMVFRVKKKIGKEHWVNENVIQYKKNSMCHIQGIVSDCLQEECNDIYQYLSYLTENNKN